MGGTTRIDRTHGWSGALLVVAAIGWWWSVRMAGDMDGSAMAMPGMDMATSLSFVAFLVAWIAMMVAMMFPAVVPVVRLYDRAARRGTVAPTGLFLLGYLLVWSAVGAPAWFAWRALEARSTAGQTGTVRLAGVALLVAAAYQVTPLKSACLRHCRSPMGFFLRVRGDLGRGAVAVRVGLQHGTVCLGCCWALMGVLVAVGTMDLRWMAVLAGLIFVEKVVPRGDLVGRGVAAVMAVMGLALVAAPHTWAGVT